MKYYGSYLLLFLTLFLAIIDGNIGLVSDGYYFVLALPSLVGLVLGISQIRTANVKRKLVISGIILNVAAVLLSGYLYLFLNTN